MLALEQRQPQQPEYNYHLLRIALEDAGKNLGQLDHEEYANLSRKADRSFALESKVIATPEAQGVVVSEVELERSVEEIAARYDSREDFVADLLLNGLDEEILRSALYRELRFNGVMQKVAAGAEAVTEVDIRLYYEMHRERFEGAEKRQASHILITVNEEFAENRRAAALARMEQIEEKLAGRVKRFRDFARRHSECPTAMEGGRLGDVTPGQLFPELDSVLFRMGTGEISPIIETEMGFHLLYCEKIKPGRRMPLPKAMEPIRELLQQRRIRTIQREWLEALS